MKIRTIKGEEITITENDIIWNALDYLCRELYDMDDYCLALGREDGAKRVSASDLQSLAHEIRPKFA